MIRQGLNLVRKELPLLLEDAENGLTTLNREIFAEHDDKLKQHDIAIREQPVRLMSCKMDSPQGNSQKRRSVTGFDMAVCRREAALHLEQRSRMSVFN